MNMIGTSHGIGKPGKSWSFTNSFSMLEKSLDFDSGH